MLGRVVRRQTGGREERDQREQCAGEPRQRRDAGRDGDSREVAELEHGGLMNNIGKMLGRNAPIDL